jgi:hypothetical protein
MWKIAEQLPEQHPDAVLAHPWMQQASARNTLVQKSKGNTGLK